MDEDIGRVEGNLGDLGKRCNARLMEKSGSNLTLLERSTKTQSADFHPVTTRYPTTR